MASQTALLGAAGEHFVMSELLRREYVAALAPAGVPTADIVVTDVEGQRLCSIQVKTRRDIGSDGGWHMKSKHEGFRGTRLFYCFVDFGKSTEDRPKVFVMPSTIVAEALQRSHQKWLATLGAKGQKHKDTVMRRLLPDYTRVFGKSGTNPYPLGWMEKFRDAWHLLGLQTAKSEAR
ncbi:MAG: hypothetical protein ABSB13_04315 [Candidatus Binatus sp.]|jgi:hypothetical protein|uniref:hypothetical protein n=1 Tax=Candidatus Binatus sp. TaxID=2811406 RepID=UPI003D137456